MSIICERCQYSTDEISNMYRHLNRKKPCKSTFSNISPIEIMNKLKKYDKSVLDYNGNRVYKCKYCEKIFKLNSSRCTHQHNCKFKEYFFKIQELTNTNNDLKNQLSNYTNESNNV